jgi:hypothetical protein
MFNRTQPHVDCQQGKYSPLGNRRAKHASQPGQRLITAKSGNCYGQDQMTSSKLIGSATGSEHRTLLAQRSFAPPREAAKMQAGAFWLRGSFLVLRREVPSLIGQRCRMTSMRKKVISPGAVHSVPADLQRVLISDPVARAKWEDITPLARNEWICWVISVKKPETRRQHIERVRTELKEGMRRPCCWPGCPHR